MEFALYIFPSVLLSLFAAYYISVKLYQYLKGKYKTAAIILSVACFFICAIIVFNLTLIAISKTIPLHC